MKTKFADIGELGILIRQNIRLARRRTAGKLGTVAIDRLRDLTKTFGFSLGRGDFLYLDGGWYITHAGLLRLAQRRRCVGIQVQQVRQFCDPVICRWVFKATVYKSRRSKGFVGYGDADPSNVSALVHGAEMRVAETRAVNRALRKAYGIGLCSVEELGSFSAPTPAVTSQSGRSRFRQRKWFESQSASPARPTLPADPAINLDPTLVKAYAADFCGTEALKDASRDLVESFISHLRRRRRKIATRLLCKLNSYAQPAEVKP